VQAETASAFDWRDGAAYAPLLGADRSLFAWEWLRRDREYRAAACAGAGDAEAAEFGLVAFEHPDRSAPVARPLWRSDVHPLVLRVERGGDARTGDQFDVRRMSHVAALVANQAAEHLLLSDGLRAVRLDGPPGTFGAEPLCLRYLLEGLASAEPALLTLQRFLALCRSGHFSRSLHPSEPRARRWILMLRAWDGIAAGAGQREIAAELLSRSAGEPRWRSRESSLRSQSQRLVRSARMLALGGYRALLGHHHAAVRNLASSTMDERKGA